MRAPHGIGRLALALAAAAAAAPGCQDGASQPPSLGCAYEVQTTSTCSDAEAPWSARCVVLDTEDDCARWTTPVALEAAGCTYERRYRAVVAAPGAGCGSSIAAQPPEPDSGARGLGEPCLEGQWCASELCAFGQYCTQPCTTPSECAPELAGGCCVGNASDGGLCMDAAECATVCGANAHPQGLPTRCVCDEGFVVDANGQRCVPEARREPGEPCTSSTDCLSGLCLGDAEAGRAWCSLSCTEQADCAPLLEAEGVTKTCCVAATAGNRCAIDTYCP